MSEPSVHSATSISGALRLRVRWLLAAHLPAVAGWLCGAPSVALLLLMALHVTVVCATLYPHAAVFGPVLRRLPVSDKRVWLTIDDGPSADTLAILHLLARFNVTATFFLVAERAIAHPELVMAINQAGHDIGNHSANHPHAWFWALPPRAMRRQIQQAQQALTELAGAPPRWFRAVVGHSNPFVEPVLRGLHLQRVSWTARAFDGVQGNVARVAASLLSQIKPGAIVLLHEGAAHGHNVAIIEQVLLGLRQRGYHAVLPD